MATNAATATSGGANSNHKLEHFLQGAAFAGDSGSSPLQPPPWLDRERFYRARDIFNRFFFSIFFAHLAGLMLIVHIPSMVGPLLSTGNSSSMVCLFRRYLGTLQHVRRWYEGDVWNPSDAAHKSIVQVRNMHKRVGDKLNKQCTAATGAISLVHEPASSPTPSSQDGESTLPAGCCPMSSSALYISQRDMALTQFAFFGLIVLYPAKIGIHCSREDLECLIHFWRGIGYLLGIDDRFNVCDGNYDETVTWCREILRGCMKPVVVNAGPESINMSRDIVRAMNTFIAFLSWEALARFWYELLEFPVNFATGFYHKTGYWLMRLTFNHLLRFRLWHQFFNYILRVVIKQTLENREYFERKIKAKATSGG